ncbi:electron transfer flavoprotein subunit alpha/FixB family protein [Dehalobacter sp. DCM]|uniref:electron transfer flavoprotein subunit alpha/FixB family protein n=1 Tax=Dehalobacter sp. DCM TaxID=2907827 RepID=UPI003081A069|nr:electron transfer flavoprotein subunit alpha/FixB family protein [Dehalobacter sp. DCM]
MQGIWIYSEDSTIAKQLLTAGLNLKEAMNQPLGVITLDAGQAKSLIDSGADKVVVLKGENNWPESYAEAIGKFAVQEETGVLLVGGTLRGKDLAAKVAVSLDAALVTDAQSIKAANGSLETTRLMYGGLAVCTEQVSLPAVLTVPPSNFEEAKPVEGRKGETSTIDVSEFDQRISVNEVCPIVRQGVDITTAGKIVCVGRGISQKEDLKIAEELAQAMGAEIACTRGIAEDYHWLPEERYIGISGQKVKPEVYISIGVSGQVQHVAGIRDSKIIVAIDSNEKAPIFEAADYGIVGDLYEVVPMLTAALGKK